MQIHQVVEEHVLRHENDPIAGSVYRRVPVMKRGSTGKIKWQGTVYEAQDGTFDLPADAANHFLRLPGWYEGASPFVDEDPEPVAPKVAPKASRSRKTAAKG